MEAHGKDVKRPALELAVFHADFAERNARNRSLSALDASEITCYARGPLPNPPNPYESRKSPAPFSDSIDFTRILPLIRCRITSSAASTLLSHYINFTALRISGRIHPNNPYLTEILPVALADDSVLHTILALSGAHMTYRSSAFDYRSRSHYAVAVRNVKHQLRKWQELDVKESMGLLTAIPFLCLFEASRSRRRQHPRRFVLPPPRQPPLLLHLRSETQTSHLLDFLVEQYAFLAIASTVCLDFDSTSPSLSVDRQLLLNSLLSDLDSLNRGSAIYGFMFGGAHQLFEMLLSYYELKIQSWRFSAHQEHSIEPDPLEGNCHISHYQTAGQIYQSILLIFLFCAFHGPSAPSQSLLDKINPCLESFIHHMQSLPIDSPSVTTMM
ncbi:hypothetical protein BDZ45DRAFT_739954 [Acephala macrosclerotiorum]|nr:hypothetical protein BDZ45DRAFT_739954 [Acephala macrosclerotiorum]